MTSRTTHTRLVIAVTVGGLLLGGCGSADPDSPPPSSTTSATSGSPGGTVSSSEPGGATPHASTPPLVQTPSSGVKPSEVTVTGTVEYRDIEGGCLALRAGAVTYELSGGDKTVLTDGARVTVRGVVRKDMVTVCQIGAVLEVISSRPA